VNWKKQPEHCSVNFKFTQKSEQKLLGKLQEYAGLDKLIAG
jgi:hypothetical protein